jgi:type VI protein secretion system component VasK
MTVDELLRELKDIQPPDAPDWWLIPPAYLVAIGVIIVIAALIWLLIRYRRANRLASLAEQDLQRIKSAYTHNRDSHELSLQLARWLKQVALLAFPARQLEGLTGLAWLHFLDESLGENRFSNGSGKIFADSVYRKQANADVGQLIELCEQWLATVKPRLQRQGRD